MALVALSALSSCSKPVYFQHELKVVVDGRHYDFIHHYKCEASTSVSEVDLKFQTGLRASGADAVAEDVGGGKLLRFLISGDCHVGAGGASAPFFGALIDTRPPIRVFEIFNDLTASGLVVESQTVDPVAKAEFEIGASNEEVLRLRTLCKLARSYSSVIAYVTPQESWSVSPEAVDYFSRMTRVTAARPGERQLTQGFPDREVYFPDWRRYYARTTAQGGIDYGRPVQFDFVDGAFRPMPRDTDLIRLPAYGIATHADGSVDVNYKGTVIPVSMMREIYDPETKEILLLEHNYTDAINRSTCDSLESS